MQAEATWTPLLANKYGLKHVLANYLRLFSLLCYVRSKILLYTKALDQVTLVGDTTGGGLGVPNGGQLPNGWIYRFSITQTLSLDQKPDYENGVPPDVFARFDWSDLSKDEVLEYAIRELLH